MRKFFTLLAIILTTLTCFAVERPRWVGQPIYVYVPECGNMSVLMKQAFMAWQNKSNSLVKFRFVAKPEDSNIEVEFVDFVSNCNSDHAVGCTHYTYMRNGQFAKNFVTIGTKEYVYTRTNGKISRKIVTRSKNHIYGVMLHEAGHAIGLGHSGDKGSIMFPTDLDDMQYLTKSDLQLLYKKYH